MALNIYQTGINCETLLIFTIIAYIPFTRDWFDMIGNRALLWLDNKDANTIPFMCTNWTCYEYIQLQRNKPFHKLHISWWTAQSICQAKNASLLSINSYGEYYLILDILRLQVNKRDFSPPKEVVFLGLDPRKVCRT